eukprot:jgi/Ulvmu1/10877/UM007_0053.1
MAGINRLGKGSAKPGTLRPTDPNRFKTEDFFSVDAEDDPEYLRRVLEVEQLAVNKTGAVLSKGAFDKNDALYLRDEADKARHDELERRDAELAQFARVKSIADTSAAMEPYDGGPAVKRPKLAKPRVAIRAAGKVPTAPTADHGGPESPDAQQRDQRQSQGPQSTEGPTQGADVGPSAPAGTAPLKDRAPATLTDTVLPAGLGLQYESSSEDGSEDSET